MNRDWLQFTTRDGTQVVLDRKQVEFIDFKGRTRKEKETGIEWQEIGLGLKSGTICHILWQSDPNELVKLITTEV